MIQVLISDSNPAFAGMIQQVLEESGRFNVTVVPSGGEAIAAAARAAFDIVILESPLENFSLRDLVIALRRAQPSLPIMVILPFGEQALPDAANFFDVQGIMSKPFYIPDLQNQIEKAMGKPVNGVLPPPRSAEPTQPHPIPEIARTPVPNSARTAPLKQRPVPPAAPAWLEDINRAAQYLTTLTLESAAEAALLMRGQHLIAFAGQCSREDADELAHTVAAQWAKESDTQQGAQVRFLRLTSGADYLVYSTLAAQDVVLSMAFQAETPLGQIRKQAKRATEALIATPAESTTGGGVAALNSAAQASTFTSIPSPVAGPALVPSASVAPDSVAESNMPAATANISAAPESTLPFSSTVIEPLVESTAAEVSPPTATSPVSTAIAAPAVLAAEPAQLQTNILTEAPPNLQTKLLPPLPQSTPDELLGKQTLDDIEIGFGWETIRAAPLPDLASDWITAADLEVEPIPDQESLNALSSQLLELQRQSLAEQPPLLDLPPAPLPNIRRTPHGLYDLSYSFLFLPRLAHLTLTGELKARLEQWLIALADTHDWDATAILIEPDHIELSLSCAPADAPERIIKTILAETSEKVLYEFPRLAASHAKRPGAFWATGYYVVTPGRRLSPEEVTAFIEYQRREQSGGRL